MRKFTAFTAVGSALLFATSVAYAADGGQVDMPVTVSFTAADKCVPKSISHTIVQLSAAEVAQVQSTPASFSIAVIKTGKATLPLDNCPVGTILNINAGGNFINAVNVQQVGGTGMPLMIEQPISEAPLWGFDGAAAGKLGMTLFLPSDRAIEPLTIIRKHGEISETKLKAENQVSLTYSINVIDRLAAKRLESGIYNSTATLIVAIK